MSRYLIDKFLFTVDRDPSLVERYRTQPAETVAWWEKERAGLILNAVTPEATTWLGFSEPERRALAEQDQVQLFSLGAHPFLLLTLWIALFERDYLQPLAMQREFALRLAHFGLPYPDIET